MNYPFPSLISTPYRFSLTSSSLSSHALLFLKSSSVSLLCLVTQLPPNHLNSSFSPSLSSRFVFCILHIFLLSSYTTSTPFPPTTPPPLLVSLVFWDFLFLFLLFLLSSRHNFLPSAFYSPLPPQQPHVLTFKTCCETTPAPKPALL